MKSKGEAKQDTPPSHFARHFPAGRREEQENGAVRQNLGMGIGIKMTGTPVDVPGVPEEEYKSELGLVQYLIEQP